jgi:hypothetical protein
LPIVKRTFACELRRPELCQYLIFTVARVHVNQVTWLEVILVILKQAEMHFLYVMEGQPLLYFLRFRAGLAIIFLEHLDVLVGYKG